MSNRRAISLTLILVVASILAAPLPAAAAVKPTKDQKQAAIAGIVLGALFQKPIRAAAVKSAKAGGKAAKYAAKVVTLRAK